MTFVPNAPCGVESLLGIVFFHNPKFVPNAPCGVERYAASSSGSSMFAEFLMHRVELKEKGGFIVRGYGKCS